MMLSPLAIDYLLPRIETYLDKLARYEWQRFVDDELDTNALLHEALLHVWESGPTFMDESDYETIVEYLEAMPAVINMFSEMELTIDEIAQDAAEWSQAQAHGIPGILRYHGLSVGDFV